jgi:hypothetical protein
MLRLVDTKNYFLIIKKILKHRSAQTILKHRSEPAAWRCCVVVEDPRRRCGGGGPVNEMRTHMEDRPSESYSSSDPWRATAIELSRPLEIYSSSS